MSFVCGGNTGRSIDDDKHTERVCDQYSIKKQKTEASSQIYKCNEQLSSLHYIFKMGSEIQKQAHSVQNGDDQQPILRDASGGITPGVSTYFLERARGEGVGVCIILCVLYLETAISTTCRLSTPRALQNQYPLSS